VIKVYFLQEVTTIKTHVDDTKISLKTKSEADKTVLKLEKIYKDITVSEGDTHDYLGMVMTFDREKKQVTINMEKYIKETLQGFKEFEPDESVKKVTTPATNNLFKTRDGDVEKSSKRQVFSIL
jgi:uncharacterized lipoprotein YehR (DUF1307 family)